MNYSLNDLPDSSQLEQEYNRIKHKRRYRSVLRSTVFTLIVIAAVSILISMLWMPVMQIYGSSMTPTLEEDNIVVAVKDSSLDQGELVAFYYGNKLLVKRYIAGPGDWVDIKKNGDIYVNGALLDEPYIEEKAYGDSDLEYPYQVPDERYFVIGDHRATSVDSRSSVVGCISSEQVVGRIVFRVWPISEIGIVN